MNGFARFCRGFGVFPLISFSIFVCIFGAEDEDRQRRVSHRHDVSATIHQQLGANVGFYLTGDNYPDFSPVGALLSQDGWMGTATLISPTCILTAAHVVLDNAYSPEPNPANWEFVMGTDFEATDAPTYPIASIHVHPGWRACMVRNNGDLKGFDLALIRLGSAVPNVAPATINANYEEIIGEVLYFAGVGSLGNGNDGITDEDNSKRFAGANELDRVNSDVSHGLAASRYSGTRGGVLGFDFDSPSGDENSLDESKLPVGELGDGTSDSMPISLESTSAAGDSGGPAFCFLDNTWRLVGVSSYGTTNSIYGDVAVYTRVANHADWIFDFLEPWPTTAWAGSGAWRTSSWFGSFFVTADGKWIYHEKHGWLYSPDGGYDLDNMWLNSKELGWVWTSSKIYPYLYSDTNKNWLYFWSGYSRRNKRLYYDFSTNDTLSFEE